MRERNEILSQKNSIQKDGSDKENNVKAGSQVTAARVSVRSAVSHSSFVVCLAHQSCTVCTVAAQISAEDVVQQEEEEDKEE